MEKQIGRYPTHGDDGNDYIVYEYEEVIDASSKDGRAELPRMRRLALRDGSAVNYIDDNTFKIVRSGVTVRRTSR